MVSDAIEVLGWTLLHFVWQGAAVGVLAAILLMALRRQSASARYLTGVTALGLMLVLPLFTIAWLERTPLSGNISPIVTMKSTIEIPRTRDDGTPALDEPPIKAERIGIDFENSPPAGAVPLIPVSDTGQTILEDLSGQRSSFAVESLLRPLIPWAVAAWLIGVGVFSLRLFAGWLSVQRLRHRASQPANETWQAMLRRLAERLRVTRPVKLVESALIEVPAVIGWLSPIILLPARAMTGLTAEQLEALLAHELAHVRRHDYLINLLQTVVETLLFYHPAVWWVSHRIRIEREHCCDDLAVSVCGNRLDYVKALVAMEQLRAFTPRLALGAGDGSLLDRVQRMVITSPDDSRRAGQHLAGLVSLLACAFAIGFMFFRLISPSSIGAKDNPFVRQQQSLKGVRFAPAREAPRRWYVKHLEWGPTWREVEGQDEYLVSEWTNTGDEPVTFTDSDFNIVIGLEARVFAPQSERQTGVQLAPKETRRIRLHWGRYVREGLWTRRENEVIRESVFPDPPSDDFVCVRLDVCNHGTGYPAMTSPARVHSGQGPAKWDRERGRVETHWDLPSRQLARMRLSSPDATDTRFRSPRELMPDRQGRIVFHHVPPGRWTLTPRIQTDVDDDEHWPAELEREFELAPGESKRVVWDQSAALGAGLPTPPERPTEGLPEDTPSTNETTDANEETFGPIQRRGQETRAERVPIEVVEEVDPEKRVIALVDGVAVHEADVTTRYSSQLSLEKTRHTPEQFRKMVDQLIRRDLPTVIQTKLLVAEAMKLFDAQQRQEAEEFIKRNLAERLVTMMKDSGVTNREELQNWLRQRGTSLERVESEYKEKLYAQQFLAKKLESAKTPEETEKLQSKLLLQLWQHAEVKSEYLPHRGEIRWVDRPNERVWINLGEADGIKRGSVFRVVSIPPNNAPAQPIVIKGKIAVIRFIDAHTSEAQILESDNDGPAKRNEVIPADFPDPKANGVDLRLLFPVRKPKEEKSRFVGQVRLKTEKPLPDLEKVVVPAGKVLDESLVFSKEGGLANVFVYLRKPTFAIEPPTEAELAKPFVLIAEDAKFWPHAALVRIGRSVIFENGAAEPMNFRTEPLRNNPLNVLVKMQDRFKAPAFEKSENIPISVKSNIKPWMLAHLLPLDHPFAAVTDEDGGFAIEGLPPGEHEFRVWHERVGYLEKSLVITIKPGEDARSELEYAPDRLKLTEAEVLAWGNRLIDAKWIPRAIVPRPAAPKKEDEGKADLSEAPDTKEPPQNQPKVETTEAEQARRAIIRQQAENDVSVRFAKKSAEVAKAEWEKLLAANRSVPAAISEFEVGRAKAKYEIALLQIEHAEVEQAAARSRLEDKSLEEPSPKTVELRQRAAKTAAEIAKANAEIVKAAIERAVTFLKTQQQENGAWQGTPADGVTALCAAALLQAGVKADDPVMQKALAHLRTIKPTLSYTVALQTMVFCSASPKEDVELIRRNVAWLEKAQATEGPNRGGWSYMENNTKFADGSCSRFAMLGLHAAKKAGFEVKAETWRNASDYWMTHQKKDNHAWSYQPGSGATPSMTLSGMACLAIVNQHLPQDEQTKLRTEAIERAVPYVELNAHLLWQSGHGGYALQCLERAAHLNRWQKFGKHELRKLLDEKLIGLQRPEGHWTGVGGGGGGFFAGAGEQTPEQKAAAEAARRRQVQSDDLIATSFALMCLTGQPEPPRERQLRIEPREMGKLFQMRSNLIENSSPPMQRTEVSGGVRIEAVEPDGSTWRIEADRVIIESRAGVNEKFESDSDVTRIICIGSVKLSSESTRLIGEQLELDLRQNGGVLYPPRILP